MRVSGFCFCFLIIFGAFLALLSAAEEPQRVVTLTVIVDGGDSVELAVPFLQDAVLKANHLFKKEFNIKFEIVELSIGPWRAPSDNFDGNAALARIAQIPRKSDIVVVFTTKNFFGDGVVEIDGEEVVTKKQCGGLAVLGGNHTIVHLEEKSELILVHELGHIFGADHSSFNRSVMNEEFIGFSSFDKKSKEVIRANRNRSF